MKATWGPEAGWKCLWRQVDLVKEDGFYQKLLHTSQIPELAIVTD